MRLFVIIVFVLVSFIISIVWTVLFYNETNGHDGKPQKQNISLEPTEFWIKSCYPSFWFVPSHAHSFVESTILFLFLFCNVFLGQWLRFDIKKTGAILYKIVAK